MHLSKNIKKYLVMISVLTLVSCNNEKVTEMDSEKPIKQERFTENYDFFTKNLKEMDKLLEYKQYDEINKIYNEVYPEKGFYDFENVEDINAIHKLAYANRNFIKQKYSLALEWLDKIPQEYKGKYTTYITELRNLSVEQVIPDLLVDFNEKDYDSIKDNYKFSLTNEEAYAIWMYGCFLGTEEWAASFEGYSSAETYGSSLGYALEYLENVPEDYSGTFSDEIKTKRDEYRRLVKIENKKAEKDANLLSVPEIGMTREEVLLSSWGQPRDINKTTNAYGTSEQWIYSNYNYLYFEDGILTSIKIRN